MPEEQTSTGSSRRAVMLVFDRDLEDSELEKLRQSTDALVAARAAVDAAHHHDVTK